MSSDSYAGWIGELVGAFIYELFTGDDHPQQQIKEREVQVIQEQNEIIADATKTMWDAYQSGYAIQRENHRRETQMMVDLFATPETTAKTLNVVGAELAFIGCFWGGPILTPIGCGLLFIAAVVAF